jgi:hypothetical protein
VACVRRGKGEKIIQCCGGKAQRKEPLGRSRRRWEVVSEWILGRLAGGGGMEGIKLAQDRDRWRALVNTEMNLRVLAPIS